MSVLNVDSPFYCGPPPFWEYCSSGSAALRNWRLAHGWTCIQGSLHKGVIRMSAYCCGSCCTAMSTVSPSPAICQTTCCSSGDGGSSSTQGFLNTIGKFGLTLAGQLQGRPVTVTNRGVSIGASAQYAAQQKQALTPVLIIIAIAVIAFLLLSKR